MPYNGATDWAPVPLCASHYSYVSLSDPAEYLVISGVPRNFVRGGGSTNSVEDRGQREQGSRGGSPLVRGS